MTTTLEDDVDDDNDGSATAVPATVVVASVFAIAGLLLFKSQ